jgi:hypothetical protein
MAVNEIKTYTFYGDDKKNYFECYTLRCYEGKFYINGHYDKDIDLLEECGGIINIYSNKWGVLTRIGKVNNTDYVSSACYAKKDARKKTIPDCKVCEYKKECVKKYSIKTEKEKLSKLFEKLKWFWGELFEGKVELYADKKELKLEKIGEIENARSKGKGYSFWKDTTGDIWLCLTPNNTWWKKYKGSIESLKKLDSDKIGEIFTKEEERIDKKKVKDNK